MDLWNLWDHEVRLGGGKYKSVVAALSAMESSRNGCVLSQR